MQFVGGLPASRTLLFLSHCCSYALRIRELVDIFTRPPFSQVNSSSDHNPGSPVCQITPRISYIGEICPNCVDLEKSYSEENPKDQAHWKKARIHSSLQVEGSDGEKLEVDASGHDR